MNRNDLAKNIYSKSLHPKHGYPFAIAGIHITASIHKIITDGQLKTHFYNESETYATEKHIEAFQQIFGNL